MFSELLTSKKRLIFLRYFRFRGFSVKRGTRGKNLKSFDTVNAYCTPIESRRRPTHRSRWQHRTTIYQYAVYVIKAGIQLACYNVARPRSRCCRDHSNPSMHNRTQPDKAIIERRFDDESTPIPPRNFRRAPATRTALSFHEQTMCSLLLEF